MRNSIVTFVLAGMLFLGAGASVMAQGANPIDVLKSDASRADKIEACRELVLKGGPEAIPALAPLLADEQLSHMARWVLEPMPGPEAGQALREALGTLTGTLKIGVISSLAIRRDEQAVPEFIRLLADGDAGIVRAAADGLAVFATPEAVQALMDAIAQANVSPANLGSFSNGLLGCAECLTGKGQREQAAAIYDRLLDVQGVLPYVHAAALRGAMLTRAPGQDLVLLADTLRGEDEAAFAIALRTAREMERNDNVTATLAGVLPQLPPERKIRLLQVLGERGRIAAGPALLTEAKDGPTDVRIAALRALARMNYAPSLELMGQLAGNEDPELAKAARSLLSYFPGGQGNAAIMAMLADAQPGARRVAVEMIGQGALEKPNSLLMKVAETDTDETVRIAALESLQRNAGIEEMPGLLADLLKAGSPSEVQAAEKALASLCERQKRTPSGALVIQKASYGNPPDGKCADVTEKVKQIVESGAFAVNATNANFGDPTPGVVKKLYVEYTENGTPTAKTAREGETLKLTVVTAPAGIVDAFCAAIGNAQGEARLAMLRLVGAAGSPKALEAIRAASAAEDAAIKETAQRALCEWPTPDALPAVMELAQTSADDTLKVLALRGAVRLLGQDSMASSDLCDRYAALMGQTRTPDEKKLVLGGLAQVPTAEALKQVFAQFADESVKAEAIQAAIAIAKNLGKSAREDGLFCNGKDLTGWHGDTKYWSCAEGAFVAQADTAPPRSSFLWSDISVRDFYLVLDVKLEPNTGNGGIQFRSEQINDYGQALGYQGDLGQDVWGRLYHEHGRGKLDWTDRAESAVKPGEWNHYEILAIGPAIWTSVNGKLGVSFLDPDPSGARSGPIALQLHAGIVQKVSYRIQKLVHDPKVEMEGMTAENLIPELVSARP